MSTTNRRRFSRVYVPVQAHLRTEAGAWSGTLRDVSMLGLFLPCSDPPSVGEACRVTIFLGEQGTSERIEAEARVARSDLVGVGVEFEALHGPDSYWHLRCLVAYNAPDPVAIEQELEGHLGIRAQRRDG